MTLRAEADRSTLTDIGGRPLATSSDAFEGLEELRSRVDVPAPSVRTPFPGGLIGFLGYEAGDALERLPPPPTDDTGVPLAWFGVYERLIVWDHQEDTCIGLATVLPGVEHTWTADRLAELVDRVAGYRAAPSQHDGAALPGRPIGGDPVPPEASTSLDRAAYEAGVERIRAHIRSGDLFQANLTRHISVPTTLSGAEVYERLVARSPAPYASYLDIGTAEVASVSPELFLRARAGRVTTKPIKGTAARGATRETDRDLANRLVASEKDRAENVMIVDLLRNDLSRVCRPGSVKVPELAVLESHAAVHHLVSTVEGRLEEGVGAVDLLRATFPGGSVTGAPKIRAMEVLRALEPARRGVYTGALGILGFHGDLELSVAIRTAVVRGGYATYGTGGGITLASVAREEWRESELKAEPFLNALGASSDPA
jgi:para-aminobenzoate synthetase component 1